MFGSQILEVAIGIVFVYLLLSLICSALNEWIAQATNTRADMLEEGIRRLLLDPSYAEKFFAHPLIKGLATHGKQPDWITPRTFALAVLDMAAPGFLAPDKDKSSQKILPDDNLGKVLSPLISHAQGDFNLAVKNLENWFNEAMEHVTQWYKQRVRVILFLLAMGATVFLNADTIAMVQSLWSNEALRTSVVAAAEEYVKQNPNANGQTALDEIENRVQGLHLPLGWLAPSGQLEFPNDPVRWFAKIIGLLFTAFAASMGAPFWFDVLNKLFGLRSSIRAKQTEKTS
ncbi:hypothetical protein HYR54_13700 [Candidatus Acetothermia bacterium]|nr:hypothetical protein [Candidatus Acetothermia bacterium]